MSKWNAVFVNDPDNDYDLMVELECDNENVGIIKRNRDGLEVVFPPTSSPISIPLGWLIEILDKARRELK